MDKKQLSSSKWGQKKSISQKLSNYQKDNHEYKCGEQKCGKYYHSYTAFYNHCKKSHGGLFPERSMYNGHLFEGPSKNRGRPRIKKTQAKDQAQIQSLKTENQLIQLIGTLVKKKKSQQIIVYVANPVNHLTQAISLAYNLGSQSNQENTYYEQLLKLNKIVADNDLPDFYDPVEIKKYADKVDSYSFTSIYFFLSNRKDVMAEQLYDGFQQSLMRKSMILWLSRNISVPVLSEIIYIVFMNEFNKNVKIQLSESCYFYNKVNKFISLYNKYFDCIKQQYGTQLYNSTSNANIQEMNENQQQNIEYEPNLLMQDPNNNDSSQILIP